MSQEEPSPISESRKMLYYTGMVMSGIGLLLFLSFFFSIAFGDPLRPDAFSGLAGRIVIGMLLLIGGGAATRVGTRGLAGSGLILDPDQARKDVEPWSRMAGGVVNDALDEVDAIKGHRSGQPPEVKIRCRKCQALSDEQSKFCNQCGAPL